MGIGGWCDPFTRLPCGQTAGAGVEGVGRDPTVAVAVAQHVGFRERKTFCMVAALDTPVCRQSGVGSAAVGRVYDAAATAALSTHRIGDGKVQRVEHGRPRNSDRNTRLRYVIKQCNAHIVRLLLQPRPSGSSLGISEGVSLTQCGI